MFLKIRDQWECFVTGDIRFYNVQGVYKYTVWLLLTAEKQELR